MPRYDVHFDYDGIGLGFPDNKAIFVTVTTPTPAAARRMAQRIVNGFRGQSASGRKLRTLRCQGVTDAA